MLHVWDTASPGPTQFSVAINEDVSHQVHQLDFAPDGSALYVMAHDRIKRFRTDDWNARPIESAIIGIQNSFAVHPVEGTLHVTGSQLVPDATSAVSLNGRTLLPLHPAYRVGGHRPEFSRNGNSTWYFSPEYSFGRWDSMNRIEYLGIEGKQRLLSKEDGENGIILHPSQELLVLPKQSKGILQLWDTARCAPLLEMSGDGVMATTFSPDGRYLAVTGDNRTRVYQVNGGRFQSHIGSGKTIVDFALHPDGRGLSASTGTVHMPHWNWMEHWNLLPSGKAELLRQSQRIFYNHYQSTRVAYAPQQRLFIQGYCSQNPDGSPISSLRDIQVDGLGVVQEVPSYRADINDVRFAPDGMAWHVAGSQLIGHDPTGLLPPQKWNYSTFGSIGNGRNTLKCVSPGRSWIVAGADDGSVHHFQMPEFKAMPITRLNHLTANKLRSIALSPDETVTAVGMQGGELYLIPVPGGQRIPPIQTMSRAVSAIAWGSNELLAVGTDRGFVKVFRRQGETLRLLLELPGQGIIDRIEWHPDGVRLFVLHREEQAVRVWHLDRLCDELRQLGLHRDLDVIAKRPLPTHERMPNLPGIEREPASGPLGLRCRIFYDVDHPLLVRDCVETKFRQDTEAERAAPPKHRPDGTIEASGWLVPRRAGRYAIRLNSARGIRLRIDGHLMIDTMDHDNRGVSADGRTEIVLEPRPYSILIESAWTSEKPKPMFDLKWELFGENGFPEQDVDDVCLFHQQPR